MKSNHGLHSFYGKNKLCTLASYDVESIGKFGRMFRDVSPLYNNPQELNKLGAKGGPMDINGSPQFTSNVPLGMIFFGQFIDHDITFDTTTSFTSINDPSNVENTRTATLDLDSIFGGGPEDEPFLYDKPNGRGLYLLTGKTNQNQGQGAALEKHDLARTGTETAIIGDPRNDENRVISQMQLAFIRFYNALYDEKKQADPHKSAAEIYEEAREEVTLHYQWIVVNEFLPLMCGSKIVNEVLGSGRKFYKPCHQAFIPVEFSVAAYRFGHSMINQDMKLQPSGTMRNIFSKEFGRGFEKIKNQGQVIEWETLFDFDGSYQRSETLDTKMASILLELPFIQSSNPADKSLATRNLRRGQSFLLPSGETIAKCMERDAAEVDNVKNLIENLANNHSIGLDNGTPLWFYILAEAEVIGRMDKNNNLPGEGLGPVGATIVAETIIGILEMDERSYLGSNRDWAPHLGTNGVFTMKDLLNIADTAVEL
ncbi:Animal haem peroxidase [Nonlabens sp. Hel1_33_55]|uniref:peroxidase family protein n=1 Tax=Nonlabens sp. Hel1_33_55 TaxID=1336802 RepID=UPI000875B533|nr:heme peroxidase family protein [Nonlabens sp. Hel1_33_55]SCY30062.1 Animal haem peroxidase [Nonlabens sp. Hel1_33_55]